MLSSITAVLPVDDVSFDRDVDISVFEATIRVLGGLLSTHELLLTFPDLLSGSAFIYGGELLILAKDLGDRLLPAFETPTGIPSHRVNLRRGMIKSETRQTCVAAAALAHGYVKEVRVDVVRTQGESRRNSVNVVSVDPGLWEPSDSGVEICRGHGAAA